MAPNRVVVRLNPGCSDADALYAPPAGNHTQVNPPTLYLEKIGQQWMEKRGDARPGVRYILEALPPGYTMWERPRPSDARALDKYLFGHPDHKRFDSPNRFYPHFEHLMNNGGSNIGCPCTVCCGSAGVLPRVSPNSSQMRSGSVASKQSTASNISAPMRPSNVGRVSVTRVPSGSIVTRVPSSFTVPLPGPVTHRPIVHKGRPKTISAGLDTSMVDEEGTPDVYRHLINKLRKDGHIDESIHEPLSPDWRAEQELLPDFLADLRTKEHWVPRTGEIVLYIRDLAKGIELVRHEVTDELQLYNEENGEFDTPEWRAGLVTEQATGSTIANLVNEDEASMNVSRSGVRVEPIPNPNHSDKSVSKQHKYVPLRQTRPFILWQELLDRVPEDEWHPTIKNALTLQATISLMGRYRFRGTWPEAHIHCHGLYLGSELLTIGDTVRLLPNGKSMQTTCTDVVVIKSFRIKWSNLDKVSSNDYDEGRPYQSYVWVYGSAYTSDASRANKEWFSDQNVEPPKVAGPYGADWYPLHPPDKELAVPYGRVLGRLYERDAMAYFLKSDAEELLDLDVGRKAVLKGREYSRAHDQRITQELNAHWYWANDRADALDLHTINGLDTTKFDRDRERNVKDMRKKHRLLDSVANEQSHSTKIRPRGLRGEGLRGFAAPTDALSRAQSIDRSTAASSDNQRSKKRSRTIDLSDDEIDDDGEEEIRQHTRVVGNNTSAPKKARVNVIIARGPPF